MRTMRIGLLSREYPPYSAVGGIATYTRTAARLLAANGHEVHVICLGPERMDTNENGVNVHRIPMGPHPLPQGRLWYRLRKACRDLLPRWLEAKTWADTAAEESARLAATLDLDVLEYPETMGEGACLKRIGRTRLVCRIHSSWMEGLAANRLERAMLLGLQRKGCRHADRIVSPSRYMIDAYARPLLRLRGPILHNPNPLHLWPGEPDWRAKSVRNVLFVGRIEYRKGIADLIEALDSMGNAAQGLTLRVAGAMLEPFDSRDGTVQALFRRHLASNGRPRGYRLEWLGPLSGETLCAQYDWAGVLAVPSLMDNYPYTALEGMSRGCCILASDAGGLPETVAGAGMLFEPGNPAELAQKMRELMQDEAGALRLGRDNARRMQRDFRPEACYRRLMDSYGEMA